MDGPCDGITLSVSGGPGMDYRPFLRDTDATLRQSHSRPHWGKMHFLNREDATALYPRGTGLRALRRSLDPQGRFLNAHLAALLGGGRPDHHQPAPGDYTRLRLSE